ncbi:hypothetical protein MACH09_37720 [Vibrio sp. MACH09]|uniref:DMT family transporter n=1 Tax=unclassified Vibrio TaxID=2614977 RepID=UPI0014938F98|nr:MULTISPECIES: DMT family transporter [unclassified Vibrio]NOI65171.1 DMT family transporter [Vibrio sp. 99-8-1]GLO63264.1 hypothetical protein MACH09_37720 [Vibrio sp. MACH09]
MPISSAIQLILLAAIWGSSFLFMRIAVPALGPAMMIELRVLLAALFLFVVAIVMKRRLDFFQYKMHFFIIGLFNTALPFLLFAYAVQTLNASTLSILNSTAAIWGTAIGVFWTKTPLTRKKTVGLCLGVLGVVVLVGWDAGQLEEGSGLAIFAGIMAAACYGIASNYTKTAPPMSSFNNAHGNMWAASLIVLPLLPFFPVKEAIGVEISLSVIALGVLCTGIAYLLYFKLIADVGAASALSVTFLIPAFGIFWGHLILDEPIGWNTVFGTLLVVSGTMLVTGFSLKAFVNKKLRKAQSR